mgnify:CR=1 FL=1
MPEHAVHHDAGYAFILMFPQPGFDPFGSIACIDNWRILARDCNSRFEAGKPVLLIWPAISEQARGDVNLSHIKRVLIDTSSGDNLRPDAIGCSTVPIRLEVDETIGWPAVRASRSPSCVVSPSSSTRAGARQ